MSDFEEQVDRLTHGLGAQMWRRMRRLIWVPRWVATPMIRKQSVAEHSHQVAAIAIWLLDHHEEGISPSFRAAILQAAIEHEHREAITGDLPSPTKGNGLPNGYETQGRVVLKCADLLEMMIWIAEEQAMGNEVMLHPIANDLLRKFPSWWAQFKWRTVESPKPPHTVLTAALGAHINITALMHPMLEENQFDEPVDAR